MNSALSTRIAAVALAVLAPTSTALAGPSGPIDDRRPAIRVTRAEVDASNKKVAMAYGALMDMWTREFADIGERFAAPRILRYSGGGYTACGPIGPSNAVYCPTNNTVYYDQVFVAAVQKVAGRNVGSDGDMAAIGIIAHEVGHAVAMQLGYHWRDSYKNESKADCLAGAFAYEAQRDGSLESGDADEAVFGMSLAGDPTPEPTGDDRADARIQRHLALNAHGTKEQRMANFRVGFQRGAGGCLVEFR